MDPQPESSDAAYESGGRCDSRRRGEALPEDLSLKTLVRRAGPPPTALEKRDWNESLTNKLWVISLHSAACRRWLAFDPPRLDEAANTLLRIEQSCREVGLSFAAAERPAIPATTRPSFDEIVRKLLVTEGALLKVMVSSDEDSGHTVRTG